MTDSTNLTLDDPRFTAFALGETDHLSAQEIAAAERLVQTDPEAAAFVAAMRGTGTALEAALQAEPAPLLTTAQRETISAARAGSAAPKPRPSVVRPYGRSFVPIAVAASGLIAIGLLWNANMSPRLASDPERETAVGVPRSAAVSRPASTNLSIHQESTATLNQRNAELNARIKGLNQQLAASESVHTVAGGTAADSDHIGVGGGAFRGPEGTVPPDSREPTDPAPPPVVQGPTTPGEAGRPIGTSLHTFGGGGGGGGARETGVDGVGSAFGRGGNTPGSVYYLYGGGGGGGTSSGSGGTGGAGGVGGTPGDGLRLADGKPIHRLLDTNGDGTEAQISNLNANLADQRNELSGDTTVLVSALRILKKQQAAIPRNVAGFYTVAVQGREVDLPGTTLGIQLEGRSDAEIAGHVVRHIRTSRETASSEWYENTIDNQFLAPKQSPLSTFSVDVDTASYSNVRRMLTQGQLPPQAAVRTEELINYFDYDYPQPDAGQPFSVSLEVAGCPWNVQNRLVRIGLQGRSVDAEERRPSNLVFLLDVSGSMQSDDKLPLMKQSMRMLVEQMREQDRVAIVVYASNARIVLESTSGANKPAIHQAINTLTAGGSTNGSQGIQWAYDIAKKHFVEGGVNRVLLGTDGDFNVGTTSREELVSMVADKAKGGVFLSILGFGTGNLKDAQLEKIADRGNGHYHYLDSLREGRRVLVEQVSGTLETIAKDVKLQVEFNPAVVKSYRLVGYANRLLAPQDFNDDTKDAGDIGAGHTVTALYEIVPIGGARAPGVDPLKYQTETQPSTEGATSGELLTVKLRYKEPEGSESKLLEVPLTDSGATYGNASREFKFAAGVAAFAMILRDSPFRGTASYGSVLELAGEGVGEDARGYRTEFLDLVRKAKSLSRQR